MNRSASGNPATERVVICLPTYNERENLQALTGAILATVQEAIILVIDDHSPDGTGVLADELANREPRIRVLHRHGKEGLGRAYCDGFRYALETLRATRIIQMDADFSHPVALLPLVLDESRQADLVLCSRYVPGGGIVKWHILRRAISRFGSWYARFWLGLPCRDLTSGFKAWQGELLRQVLRHPISSGGYTFQVETTYISSQLQAKITELPFVFDDRREGKSKMSKAIVFEAFWRIPLLRLKGCRAVRPSDGAGCPAPSKR